MEGGGADGRSGGVQDNNRLARLMEGGIERDEWTDGQISE